MTQTERKTPLKTIHFLTFLILLFSFTAASCSKPAIKEAAPEERIREARKDIEKRHYEKAYQDLEELKFATAGTRLGGEVQYLLGEAAFKRGKFPEAESHYAAYMNAYPGGPFSEQAVYMQAMSKIRQIQKRSFLTFRTYIPHDRDVTLIREARTLFEIYTQTYPDGQWMDVARQKVKELRMKEGMHELEIADFYLRKKSPVSALARARRILEGDYPQAIKDKARDLMRKAEGTLDQDGESQNL